MPQASLDDDIIYVTIQMNILEAWNMPQASFNDDIIYVTIQMNILQDVKYATGELRWWYYLCHNTNEYPSRREICLSDLSNIKNNSQKKSDLV